jgi:hypothetical protein
MGKRGAALSGRSRIEYDLDQTRKRIILDDDDSHSLYQSV